MKTIEFIVILLVLIFITTIIGWFLSEYISHHLGIPFILVFAIALVFPPFWWLLLLLAFIMSRYHPKPPAYPRPYSPPY